MMSAMARQQRGFTLVEAIIVIVIIGVLSAVVAVFIRTPVQSYVDSVGRAEVSDEADLALRRIARDLRAALPNSVRVTPDGHAVEFLPTVAGGRYLAAEDGAAGPGQYVLDFVNPSGANPNINVFTVLGAVSSPNLDPALEPLYVVVYNLGPGFPTADAYLLNAGGQRNITRITAFDRSGDPVNGPITAIHMSDNPFAAQDPPLPSPGSRFQVVRRPVTYFCGAQNGVLSLWRVSGYNIPASANYADPVPGTGTWAMIANHVDHCDGVFDYTVTTQSTITNSINMQHSALVVMSLALRARNETDPTIRLVHQVHVDNTP
jgi:MSHA biogenesis protein MshO